MPFLLHTDLGDRAPAFEAQALIRHADQRSTVDDCHAGPKDFKKAVNKRKRIVRLITQKGEQDGFGTDNSD